MITLIHNGNYEEYKLDDNSNARSLAILLTCFNRVDFSTQCLKRVYQQDSLNKIQFDIYLVDDGSTDGTSEKISNLFPDVKVLKGEGSLYWAGGMRKAFGEAINFGYDFYLWLNDDTFLYSNALKQLFSTYDHMAHQENGPVMIVGSTLDVERRELSYGGVIRSEGGHRMSFTRVLPGEEPKQCHTINGNCVLIPHPVVQRVGNLDPCFSHSMGDFDYGFRAVRQGCTIWVHPGFVGTCSLNDGGGGWSDRSLPFRQRWKILMSPKGLPPREYWFFVRRHAGRIWLLHWIWLYAKVLASCWR